jgi:acetylglutamate kinase
VTALSAAEVEEMTRAGIIAGGMIPKTETAIHAVRNGVRACTIVDGRVSNAVLLELFTDHGAGSMIRA